MTKLLALFALLASAALGQSVGCIPSSGPTYPCALTPIVSEAQAVNVKVSGGAGTTITQAFAGATTRGNTIVCMGMESAAAIPVFTDADSNTYAVVASSATAPGYSIAVANNIAGTTSDIVTLTTTSGAAAFACHELKGAVAVGQSWDLSNGQQGTGSTITYSATVAQFPGEMVLSAVGLGGGTVNATPALGGINTSLVTVDAANTAVTGGAALSIFYAAHTSLSTAASFTQTESLNASQTYSGVLVSVKPPILGITSSALPAGTNVIGHVIADTGSTTAVTQATGTNLHAVLDTTSTTAVTQATGSNLHAVLDAGSAVIGHTINDTGSTTAVTGNVAVTQADGADTTLGAKADAKSTATDTTAVTVMQVLKQISASAQAPPSQAVTNAGTFAVQSAATLSAETTKVIGTARLLGNGGATLDSAPQATAPTNGVAAFGAGVNAEQTAATNGQAQRIITDLVGKLIVLPYANPENFLNGTTAAITDTTSTSVIASAGGSLRNYVTACAATNSHASVDTFVKILDGSTIIWEELAMHGQGWNMTFPTPLRGTAATAVNAQMVTTGANVIVSCTGYKGL